MIKLIVEPRVTKSWNEFIKQIPSYSIALDGYVKGPTNYQPKGPRLNVNHHEGIDRLSTRSSSAQIYILIKQGLLKRFKEDNDLKLNIYINHPDQDVCLAIWLLLNHKRIIKKNEYLIENLVNIEDKLDITGGAYPFDENSDIIKEIAWVFEPYTRARSFGKLDNANNNEIKQLIRSILTRIDKHCGGKSEKINLDARYKIIYSNKNWYMVDEIGAYARMRLVKDGIKAFVSVKKRFDGNYNYVLLKTNPFILFPINEMYHKLNKIEKNKIEKWGGGDIIGGSPRITGSKIKPEEMIEIINKLFK